MKKQKKNFVLIALIVGLLFFLHYVRILSPLENLAVNISKPLFRGANGLSQYIGDSYLEYRTKQEVIKENKSLREQVISLTKEKSRWLSALEENDFLSKQMNFVKNNNYVFSVAHVIGMSINDSQNILILDKGTSNGIAVGQPVIVDDGFIVGKIDKVNKYNSFVLLINDDLSKVAARVQNNSRTVGIAEGEFGLSVKMRLIPQTEIIKEGDLIITSGLESFVPKGLLIGTVSRILGDPEDLFQEAIVQPMSDLSKISLVTVIIGNKDAN